MSKAACKAVIDGEALSAAGRAAESSPDVKKVFESPEGSALVWEIADRCAKLGIMVTAALRPRGG
jgi:hypothetical protein